MNYLYAAIAIALFGGGFYFGGLKSKDALTAVQLKQTQSALLATQNALRDSTAAQVKLQITVNAYDAIKDIPDPIALNVSRLLVAKTRDCPGVPQATTVARGTEGPAPIPSGAARVAASLDRYILACSADAKQMIAMEEAAP